MKKVDIVIFSITNLMSIGLFISFNKLKWKLDKEVVISSNGEMSAQIKLDGKEDQVMIKNEHGYKIFFRLMSYRG